MARYGRHLAWAYSTRYHMIHNVAHASQKMIFDRINVYKATRVVVFDEMAYYQGHSNITSMTTVLIELDKELWQCSSLVSPDRG